MHAIECAAKIIEMTFKVLQSVQIKVCNPDILFLQAICAIIFYSEFNQIETSRCNVKLSFMREKQAKDAKVVNLISILRVFKDK